MSYDLDELSKKMFKIEKDVKPSYTLNQETLNKAKECCEMNKKGINFKLNGFAKFAIACTFLCLIVGISVPAYNGYMARKWKSNITFLDEYGDVKETVEITDEVSCKKIPDTFPKEKQKTEMTISEIEELLGFHILDSERNPEGTAAYFLCLNKDGSIARVDVWRANYAEFNGWNSISMNVVILNEGAELEYKLAVEDDVDAMGGKEFVKKIHSDNLDTDIVIYWTSMYNEADELVRGQINAIFQHDNMLYMISGSDMGEDDMINFVLELKAE